MWPWKRKLSRDEARAAQRAAKLRPPPPKIRRTVRQVLGPRFGQRLFTAAAWLAGWALFAWAAFEAVGPWGWKVAAGSALLAAGGFKPLAKVLLGGLVAFPPRDWFSEDDG